MEQVARAPSTAPARGRHTWCRAPNYPAWQVLLGGKRRRRGAPLAGGGAEGAAGGGLWRERSPKPIARRLRTRGPRGVAAGDSGWRMKPEKIKGEACGKGSGRAACWRACGGGAGGMRSCFEFTGG